MEDYNIKNTIISLTRLWLYSRYWHFSKSGTGNVMSVFKGIRKTLSHSQQLNGTKEQIFPLLCPIREYDWIENWSCDLIYSDSGFAECDCVFRTINSGTGLEEVGNRAIAARQQSDFSAIMQAIEAKLNYYLLHGKCQRDE